MESIEFNNQAKQLQSPKGAAPLMHIGILKTKRFWLNKTKVAHDCRNLGYTGKH